ncbi:hypothetical protein CXT76_02580 [Candidatus Parvarchaeota archaeon]|nr:MAG: hypothetical protein CXT76_02580 [Candidatus Parvarchaeota archaeon]
MIPFSSRYSFIRLISSVTIGLPIIVLLLLIIHKILINFGLLKFLRISFLSKFPKQLTTLITGVILFGILSSLPFGPFGPSFIIDQIKDIKSNLVSPATSRLIQTVAENRQPFFSEWANNFGPLIFNFPILFWLFFIGSVYIFNRTIISFKKKDRFYLCFTYFLFLSSVIFSRYSQDSLFNGTNVPSLLFYSSGFLIFAYTLGYYYYSYYKNGLFNKIRKIDMSLVFLLVFSLLGLISARGAVRLIMVLSIPVSIIVSYFVISFSIKSFKKSNDNGFIKLIISIFLILALLWAGFQLYSQDYSNAGAYIPSPYTHQWQKAMSWVRSETPQNSVFGHWWDYGYWIQSIGERATVLDGGNSISYWNHMMGRYALTGKNSEEALEFLYSHNTTHFLIDSTDIGKYSAFSTIGSDINYDRASYLPIFLKDNSLTSEKKNSIVSVYKGGSYLDEDIIYENSSGERIFLPGNRAAIGGIMISRDRISGYLTGPPTGVFIYNDQQIYLPLRYAYSDEKLLDFGFGVEAGIFSFPKVSPNSFERNGAIIYLSKRTVKSNLARIYLYNEKNSGFNLVHSEDDLLVAELKKLNPEIKEDIIYYQGLRGPIKIWELDYPTDIEFKEEYLETHYPSELRIAS